MAFYLFFKVYIRTCNSLQVSLRGKLLNKEKENTPSFINNITRMYIFGKYD